MHSSLSQTRSPIVFTPRSDIDNATSGSVLSFEKLSERVPKFNWFKIESMLSKDRNSCAGNKMVDHQHRCPLHCGFSKSSYPDPR